MPNFGPAEAEYIKKIRAAMAGKCGNTPFHDDWVPLVSTQMKNKKVEH
jgi:hypothetical protein